MAFVAGSVVLSACGAKTEPNETPTQQQEQQQSMVGTKTIISLAEAERLIVSALAIDNNQLQTQSTNSMRVFAASANEGNRDVLEKLCLFNYHISMDESDIESGDVFYKNGNFKRCLRTLTWEDKEQVEYYDEDGNCYTKYRDHTSHEDGNYGNDYLCYLQILFADEAFDRIYDDNATKETNQDGYSITLSGKFNKFMYYQFLVSCNGNEAKAKEELEEFQQDSNNDVDTFDVTININNSNDVIDASVFMKGVSREAKVVVAKTNTPVVEPEWVTEYKRTHA